MGWGPQPGPQTALTTCPCEDVFFGGARGGGKTDGLLGDFLLHQNRYGENVRGIIFRRSYPELEKVEERAVELFRRAGADYQITKRTFTFPNGATCRLRYMDRDKDADNYQGHEYTYQGWDELGNWPDPNPVDKLMATLRSPHGIPCLRRSTGNPGGPGHNWVKMRYIDPAGPYKIHKHVIPNPDGEDVVIQRVFIPATLDDNPILVKNDPTYWARVVESAGGREWLLKAWRYGIWDIVAGGFFDHVWSPSHHILRPFDIPKAWRIDRSFDWGSSKPFSVGWWAESDGTTAPNGITYPRETLFRIYEYYGWDGKRPNVGIMRADVDIARDILSYEAAWGIRNRVLPGPADTAIFDTDVNRKGMSIAQMMAKEGVHWTPADKKPGSRIIGWEAVNRRLLAAKEGRDEPRLYVFDRCRQFIRTVPTLQRDEKKTDDVDTNSEDHVADETRYRVMAPKREAATQEWRV